MIVSVINHTAWPDRDVLPVIRAINRQLAEDVASYWHCDVQLRLDGGKHTDTKHQMQRLRGDAVIYLEAEATKEVDILGFHQLNHHGLPYGMVFFDLCQEFGEAWSVALSHEALELAINPEAQLCVRGPHPTQAHDVFYWYEICDPVQRQHYEIDGIKVCNFVLPLFFTKRDETGQRNDFLGTPGLRSLSCTKGGYLGYFNPESGKNETFWLPHDEAAQHRFVKKTKEHESSRIHRVQRGHGEHRDTTGLALEGSIFAEGLTLLFTAKAKHDTVIADVLGTEWTKRWLLEDEGEEETHRAFALLWLDEMKPLSSAKVWEFSHAFARREDVVEAEPILSLDIPTSKSSPTLAARRGKHKPGTEAHDWALKKLRVDKAWGLEPPHADGRQKGEGILIGHPDTGYTKHPQLKGALNLEVAYDFIDGDHEPYDANRTGHGTRIASSIVSREDESPSGPHVTGTAPRAMLAPLRCSTWVILHNANMRRLYRAIDYAADNGCHVISISMGSPFGSRRLRRAVKKAIKQGVIVLGAAGNVYPGVVFPAAYEEVVAVAGTDIDDLRWFKSATGSEVDVSAPAESVWCAWPEIGRHQTRYEVLRSEGTSYAVAQTAGIAALWLAYHGRDRLIQRYGKKKLVSVFRRLLKRTARVPYEDWDSNRMGAGIVDAEALLSAKLPASSRIKEDNDDDLWLAARIGEQGDDIASTIPLQEVLQAVDAAQVHRGTLRFLGAQANRVSEGLLFSLSQELAFYLRCSEVWRKSFVAWLQGVPAQTKQTLSADSERELVALRRWLNTMPVSKTLRALL